MDQVYCYCEATNFAVKTRKRYQVLMAIVKLSRKIFDQTDKSISWPFGTTLAALQPSAS